MCNFNSAPTKNADLLITLCERYVAEKDLLMSELRSSPGTTAKSIITTAFCRLSRQHVLGELEDPFVTATIAIGLAERAQEYRAQRYVL